MKTDYKFHRVTQHDNGNLTVIIRIYEGDITTESEREGKETKEVAHYRRTRMIREETYGLPATSEKELHKLLKKELRKDGLTPIDEQK